MGMGKHTFVVTAVLATVLAAAPLASAQNRQRWPGGNGGGNGGNRGGSEQRGGGGEQRGGGGEQRRSGGGEQRQGGGGGGEQRRAERQAQPRDGGRVDAAPRTEQRDRAQRDGAQRDGNRRDDGRGAPRRRGVDRYAVPRTGPTPRYRDGDRRVYVQPRSNYYVYRYPSYRYYGGTRYYNYRYYDPYFRGDFYWSNYAWRPRTYYYGNNWDYDLGKLRLDIDQRDAEVYIDGYYAGVVDEFDGVLQGLRLEPGNYRVEVALPGFEPLDFDVHVTPGRTTTYRGSLLPEP
jgi:hypothetical protein